MKPYKKTLIGTVITIFIGSSCCWVSSAAIGLGSIAIVGTLIEILVHHQKPLIFSCVILLLITLWRLWTYHKTQSNKD